MATKKSRQRAPIFDAITKYAGEKNLRLHMPGHLGGRGMPAVFKRLATLDVSEVPGIDDLHLAEASIYEAQQAMARAFGSKESFFLLNGATSGLHALLLSLPPDAGILIPRNAHKSLWGGLVLSGAFPVYMPCTYDKEIGIAVALEAEAVKEKLEAHPRIRAVFVTSPTYYGTSSNIRQIHNETQKMDALLMVDEAHGGHFAFHSAYPEPALKQGANVVVNGLHKTLPVLNQGACLHVGTDFKPIEQLVNSFRLLSTTSPSFPILASIDLARLLMEEEGYELLEAARQRSAFYGRKINGLEGLRVYDAASIKTVPGIVKQDPLKLLIKISGLGKDGYELARILREHYQIQVEMQGPRFVLAMMSMFHSDEEWEKLYLALKDIDEKFSLPAAGTEELHIPPIPEVVLSPRQSFFSTKRAIKLQDCVGKVAGEMVAPYPPGIPCLLPGELINAESLDYLWYIKQSKLKVHGLKDPELNYITIID